MANALTLASLSQAGAFTGAPVEKEISFTTQAGEEMTFVTYVRRMGYQQVRNDIQSGATGRDVLAARIATAICDENGNSVFRAEDVTGEPYRDLVEGEIEETLNANGPMEYGLVYALLGAIQEVNNPKGKGQTKSARKKKSGTNSSSTASVDAQ